MKIVIDTIPHHEHRYPTVGDYWVDADGVLQIRVSETEDPRHSALVAVHELVEAVLVRDIGIAMAVIDDFDMRHAVQAAPKYEEPGDDPKAPYHRQHTFATAVERLMAREMDVSWQDYEDALGGLV